MSLLVTPWSFHAAMATRKIGPALAAGCPVVLKPAEDTPVTALALADLLTEAGVPTGVVNVVTTGQATAGSVVAAIMNAGAAARSSLAGGCRSAGATSTSRPSSTVRSRGRDLEHRDLRSRSPGRSVQRRGRRNPPGQCHRVWAGRLRRHPELAPGVPGDAALRGCVMAGRASNAGGNCAPRTLGRYERRCGGMEQA